MNASRGVFYGGMFRNAPASRGGSPVTVSMRHRRRSLAEPIGPTPVTSSVVSAWQELHSWHRIDHRGDDGKPLFVVWQDEYGVGWDPIDRQHKQLVAMLNDFYVAIQEGNDAGTITEMLQRLADYAQDHFVFEERVMKEHEYPDLPKHRLLHLALKDKTDRWLRQSPRAAQDISADVFRFLKGWWTGHILNQDRLFAPYLKSETNAET